MIYGIMYIMPEHGAGMPNPQRIKAIFMICVPCRLDQHRSFNVEWSRRYELCTLKSKLVIQLFDGYNSISVMHMDMELVWLLREYMHAGVKIEIYALHLHMATGSFLLFIDCTPCFFYLHYVHHRISIWVYKINIFSSRWQT